MSQLSKMRQAETSGNPKPKREARGSETGAKRRHVGRPDTIRSARRSTRLKPAYASSRPNFKVLSSDPKWRSSTWPCNSF
jgi:hypothetical protein